MALGIFDNSNYGFHEEKVGTFTPNFTPDTGSYLNVKQVGNVVFLSGMLVIDGTWADITNNHLGDISGVDVPASLPFINVLSSVDASTWHDGVISAANGGNDTTYLGMSVTGTDIILLINGFYFTA